MGGGDNLLLRPIDRLCNAKQTDNILHLQYCCSRSWSHILSFVLGRTCPDMTSTRPGRRNGNCGKPTRSGAPRFDRTSKCPVTFAILSSRFTVTRRRTTATRWRNRNASQRSVQNRGEGREGEKLASKCRFRRDEILVT